MALAVLIWVACATGLSAQQVDHWETLVQEADQWTYLTPLAPMPATWMQPGFDDSTWLLSQGGFGFGDGDDVTLTPSGVPSILVRTAFNVTDPAIVASLILAMDYDDGFVAYLNGTEVARANLGTGGQAVGFDALADGDHEALLYLGGSPELFTVPNSLLVAGANVLAVQVHNRAATSSDMSCRPFLLAGITVADAGFGPAPSWFVPPVQLITHLPIIRISTNGQAIPDSPRIVAQMEVVDNGPGNLNHFNDPAAGYSGLVSIEVRGSSSQGFPKKQYAFETQDSAGQAFNVSLLGMPSENDWILHAPYSDKTLMRNFLTYDLWSRMGNYTTRTRYCEVLLNGDYQGVYVLMEQIKWDNDRVDVEKMDSDDVAGDSLTGGYIIKVDKTTASGQIDWYSTVPEFDGVTNSVGFQYDYPKRTLITPQQGAYIQQYVADFEEALVSDSFASPLTGYKRFADVGTFIDFFLIQEFTKNVDGYRLSTYLNKQRDSRGGLLRMGPAWDFNITLGNADYCGGESFQGWALDFPCGLEYLPFWWRRMNQDSTYIAQLICRYSQLRQSEWDTVRIFNWIDSITGHLGPAISRNFARWPTLGTYVWPNYYIGQTYDEEVQYLKYWIGQRIAWLDSVLPPPPPMCHSPHAGSVVVSEINHSPGAPAPTGDWVEIHSISPVSIDLSFWRLRDSSPFNDFVVPFGTVLAPEGRTVLCRQPEAFNAMHVDTVPYIGPFGFGLNGQSETLILLDAEGRSVQEFSYSSIFPWPSGANATGRTLEYLGSPAEPSLPESWFVGCVGGSPGSAFVPCDVTTVRDTERHSLQLYPNPATDRIALNCDEMIVEYRITDPMGRLQTVQRPMTHSVALHLHRWAPGVYHLRAILNNGDEASRNFVIVR